MQGWWTSFFDSTYATIGLETSDVAKRDATIDLIVQLLQLSPGDTVFDQCCGIGRISIPLARRGYNIIGVDQGMRYADTARERAATENLPCELYTGDAFDFVAPRKCNAGINWFTSFGYDRDDRVNIKMLQRARESLVPGGRFALEYISIAKVFAEFRSCMLDKMTLDGQELWLIQEPSIDFKGGMIQGSWTFLRTDGTREVRRTENRAYMPHELIRLFTEAGFVDVDIFGSDAKAFERTSRRLIVVGRA